MRILSISISLIILSGCSSELDRCIEANTEENNFLEKFTYAFNENSKFIKQAEIEIELGNKEQSNIYVEKASKVAEDFYENLNDIEDEIHRCYMLRASLVKPQSIEDKVELAKACNSTMAQPSDEPIKICNAQGIY